MLTECVLTEGSARVTLAAPLLRKNNKHCQVKLNRNEIKAATAANNSVMFVVFREFNNECITTLICSSAQSISACHTHCCAEHRASEEAAPSKVVPEAQ